MRKKRRPADELSREAQWDLYKGLLEIYLTQAQGEYGEHFGLMWRAMQAAKVQFTKLTPEDFAAIEAEVKKSLDVIGGELETMVGHKIPRMGDLKLH